MLQSALYFPMIRGREGEIHAIHRLSPLARARIALIVDLPTKELAPTQSLDQYVSGFVSDIAAAWGTTHALYLDMNRYGPEQAACADRFALAVVASVAENKRQTVLGLNDLALKHTFMILSTKHIPTQSLQTFFWLTLQAVHGMRFLTKPDELRETWALAEVLPDFARATALWSSPDLVSKHKILACELFRRVGCLPLSRAARDLQMSQMLCLLDFSVSSCATTGDAALIARIISLWGDAYEDWLPITDQWSSAAEMLVGAITSEGLDRARLFADPTFASSYCRQIIEAQKP
jgi:Beta protein